ncbi:predicted protein [Plenodomus lingam JN3]|uniref:Predicted protein n=1 Tax=Leptosphaeria maculans (strain JN3 / isolate v23.1.3 / race Av1-4-5-6-7-8) TaxID=985895 RepID=E5A2L9_LEPMJ|nr:predicted protein [Plenodomus lingam JN3]CBX97815.1 predicted protein [Plenodomus lingam JN3]
MFSDPVSSLYWRPPDVAHYDMEALLFSSSGWLRTACVVSALFWVAFRAYQVLSQPVKKLVQVLGLEMARCSNGSGQTSEHPSSRTRDASMA